MIPVALVMMGVGFGWAILNFGAASMHPAPSLENFGTHIVLGGIFGVFGFIGLVIELWTMFA